MRYLSLFSGIEACTQAWHALGWEPVAFCEFEKFPSDVLAHHCPDVPNLGDITKITDDDIAALGPIDLVVGGSPCQDLSVAGKRAGLAGSRSGLFANQMAVFHAARHFCGARWCLWENVPGAFSSNAGRDFASVVGAMAGCEFGVPRDGWKNTGVAAGPNGLVEWRTLDAQYVRVESHPRAVPQRRRRVFALLDTGDWPIRPPVLLEPESMRGDSAPRREAGEGVAALTANGVGTCGADDNQGQAGHLIATASGEDVAPCLIKSMSSGVGNTQDAAIIGCAYSLRGEGFDASEHGTGRGTPIVPVAFGVQKSAAQGADVCEQHSPPLATTKTPALMFFSGVHTTGHQGDRAFGPNDAWCSLAAQGGNNGGGAGGLLIEPYAVRRLTPVECERLQGFPDDFTAIPWRGKPADQCPDGPRYKALGNSMAVNVMRWIGQRISEVYT